jgi:hypothetical protein
LGRGARILVGWKAVACVVLGVAEGLRGREREVGVQPEVRGGLPGCWKICRLGGLGNLEIWKLRRDRLEDGDVMRGSCDVMSKDVRWWWSRLVLRRWFDA